MNVVEFKPRHLIDIGPCFAMYGYAQADAAYGQMLKDNGPCWTLEHNGRLVGCGGIVKDHATMGTAWTILTDESGGCMTRIHRLANRVLALSPFVRVQAHIDPTFNAAIRWANLLGFTYEGPMRKFTPDGRTMHLYARIR